MHVIDDTNELWQLRYQEHGRENGAATYSRELVKYQVPIWQRLIEQTDIDPDKVVISTCPLINETDLALLPRDTELVVQYLHRYPHREPMTDVAKVLKALPGVKNIVFVTAYNSFAHYLRKQGVNVIFMPMTVDNTELLKIAATQEKHNQKRVIYFGNLLHGKQRVYPLIKAAFEKAGWKFDTIADGYFNGKQKVNQQEAWQIISQYSYGIGVGRCALEMYELGLKVVVCGKAFAGLVTNEREFAAQIGTNFNARVVTFDRTIDTCIACIDDSGIFTHSIQRQLPEVEKIISDYVGAL
ncbi:MAG: hypothetical protein WC426_13675 [Sulfuriferula sp.]